MNAPIKSGHQMRELVTTNHDYFYEYTSTKEEIEELVVLVRLELYNRSLHCGPKAIRKRLDEFYHVSPLPSERTIARILARNGLTHRRTGWYE